MSEYDLYYLRSILNQLKEYRKIFDDWDGSALGHEALADNIDWLDCFISRHDK